MPYGVFLLNYLLLWGLFLFVARAVGAIWPREISGMDLLLLSLATFRLTEIVTEEKVARVIRAPFADEVTVQKENGEEETQEVPRGTGFRRVVGEMILCPWCTGVWIATLLTFAWVLIPAVAKVILIAFAVAAGGMIFQITTKLLDRTRTSIPERRQA
jgi:hypothetical protein